MARPIKDTPILYGKNAIRMLNEVAHVKPLPEERIARIKQARISLSKIQKNSYEDAGIKFKCNTLIDKHYRVHVGCAVCKLIFCGFVFRKNGKTFFKSRKAGCPCSGYEDLAALTESPFFLFVQVIAPRWIASLRSQ